MAKRNYSPQMVLRSRVLNFLRRKSRN